jgi:hypothetical protein
MDHITEQEWERYQGEVNTARRGLQDFHLRPLDEAIAAYRDEVTVTHQQLVDHDVDVVRRFVTKLIARICAKGYVRAIPEVAAEFGYTDKLDITAPTMHVDERRAVRKFVERIKARMPKGGITPYAIQVMNDEAAKEDIFVADDTRSMTKQDKQIELLSRAVQLFSRLNLIQGQQIIRSSIGMPHGGLVTEKRNIQDKLHELRKELRQYE